MGARHAAPDAAAPHPNGLQLRAELERQAAEKGVQLKLPPAPGGGSSSGSGNGGGSDAAPQR